MPSVQLTNDAYAVASQSIGTGSASRPHVLMGWVRSTNGVGRNLNHLMGSFRSASTTTEVVGNIGFGTTTATADGTNIGRDAFSLGITYYDSIRIPVNFPDVTQWYYVVLQFGSGSDLNTNMKIFNGSSLTKYSDVTYTNFATVSLERYMGISSPVFGYGGATQFKHLRAFYSGAFTDAECIAQARSTTPVAHNTAVLWDAWSFDALQFTGSINNKVLNVTGTPTLAPDQPFVFINSTTLVTGSNSSQVQISTTGYSPVIIGAR